MLKEAIEFNTIALKKSFYQFRYEESIQFGKNILEMREKFKDNTSVEKIIEIKLMISQSLIIIGGKPEVIDKYIEECKSIVDKSLSLVDKSLWKLLILNVEGDASVHDHSGYFDKQRDEISEQINSIVNHINIESNFSLLYSKLTLIRLNNYIESNEKYKLLFQLLEQVENQDNIDTEITRNPISGFKNGSIIDYMILKSEILEEIIHLSYILNDNDLTLKYIEECKLLKENKKINDQEGLSFIYLHEGDIYIKLNKFDEAFVSYENSKAISKRIGSEKLEALSNVGSAYIHIEKKEYDKGLNFLIESLKLNIFDDFDIQYKVYIGIIKIAYSTKSKDLFNEYIKDINSLFDLDKNKAYLHDELKGCIEKIDEQNK